MDVRKRRQKRSDACPAEQVTSDDVRGFPASITRQRRHSIPGVQLQPLLVPSHPHPHADVDNDDAERLLPRPHRGPSLPRAHSPCSLLPPRTRLFNRRHHTPHPTSRSLHPPSRHRFPTTTEKTTEQRSRELRLWKTCIADAGTGGAEREGRDRGLCR